MEENKSEVARIKREIEAEQESAQRALQSSAYGTAQHQFITRRMERMGALHERLKELAGEDEANNFIVQTMQKEAQDDGKE